LNVFISGALVLLDGSLRWLALVGLLEIGVVLALTLSRRPEEAAHAGHDHDAHDAAAHAPAAPGH
jgi:NADH-quinone oxidoreductase subunit H